MILIFANFWIFQILRQNLFIGLMLVAASLALIKNKFFYSFILIIFLCFAQIKTNKPPRFTPTPLQKQQQFQRINFYPQSLLPLSYYYEARPEANIFRHLQSNFISIFNLNTYFFAYHPRQDNSLDIYPKFHFLFLPLLIVGALKLAQKKSHLYLVLPPLITLTIFGKANPLGAFCLFPFFIWSFFKSVQAD